MFKYTCFLALVLATTVTLVCAEPPRSRIALRRSAAQRTSVRFLARQEEVEDTAGDAPAPVDVPAPYPPAGVTPETPFELPTETEATAPDQTYGPPESTYGPPAAEGDASTATPKPAANLVSQNLIQPRQNIAAGQQRGFVRSQPLLLRASPVSGAAPRPGLVELVRAEPEIIYVLK